MPQTDCKTKTERWTRNSGRATYHRDVRLIRAILIAIKVKFTRGMRVCVCKQRLSGRSGALDPAQLLMYIGWNNPITANQCSRRSRSWTRRDVTDQCKLMACQLPRWHYNSVTQTYPHYHPPAQCSNRSVHWFESWMCVTMFSDSKHSSAKNCNISSSTSRFVALSSRPETVDGDVIVVRLTDTRWRQCRRGVDS